MHADDTQPEDNECAPHLPALAAQVRVACRVVEHRACRRHGKVGRHMHCRPTAVAMKGLPRVRAGSTLAPPAARRITTARRRRNKYTTEMRARAVLRETHNNSER